MLAYICRTGIALAPNFVVAHWLHPNRRTSLNHGLLRISFTGLFELGYFECVQPSLDAPCFGD